MVSYTSIMRRYMEHEESMAAFFLAYFLYGKIKYGTKGYSDGRLGSMSAYKSVMQVYRPYLLQKERVRSDSIIQRFEHLEKRARALPDDKFKTAFLAALEEVDPRHRSPES